MYRVWRKGAAASVLALAAAIGLGQGGAAAQEHAPATGTAPSPEQITDTQLNQAREENRRWTEYAEQLRQRNEAISLAVEEEDARIALERQAIERQLAQEAEQLKIDRRFVQQQIARERAELRASVDLENTRRQGRRALAEATEPSRWNAFFSRSNGGMPGECRPRGPAVPDLDAPPQTLDGVLSNLQQCYFAFTERGEPFVNRRAAYSGVSTVGALGGAIGGSAIAPTTAAAWGGLVLLPIIVEGTVDRPEFDSLDRVTARGLNWVNGRAVQMNAIQRRLANEAGTLDAEIADFNSTWIETEREMLQDLIRGAGAPSETLPDPAEDEQQEDPSADVTSAAALRLQQSVGAILNEARATQRDAMATQDHIGDVLPTWTQMRFNRVMDNYGSHRREMTLRPQAAARAIVALPFSSLASFIRGSDERVRTQEYFTSTVAASLRGLHSPIGLPTLRSRDAVAIDYLNLSEFPEVPRAAIRDMVDRANRLQEATQHARALLAHAKAVDEAPVPLFDEVGAEAAQNEAAAAESQRAATETPPTQQPAPTEPPPPPPPADNTGGANGNTAPTEGGNGGNTGDRGNEGDD